jgi:hypothetical protein
VYRAEYRIVKSGFQRTRAAIKSRAFAHMRRVAEEAFHVAYGLVPVKTGFLRSTIQLLAYGEEYIRLIVWAPYAQIVEYRRPFVRPAVEAVKPMLGRNLAAIVEGA